MSEEEALSIYPSSDSDFELELALGNKSKTASKSYNKQKKKAGEAKKKDTPLKNKVNKTQEDEELRKTVKKTPRAKKTRRATISRSLSHADKQAGDKAQDKALEIASAARLLAHGDVSMSAEDRIRLPFPSAIHACSGQSLTNKSNSGGRQQHKYLVVMPGSLRGLKAGMSIGSIEGFGTAHPTMTINYPAPNAGKLVLRGAFVYPRHGYLHLLANDNGTGIKCNASFAELLVFTEYAWMSPSGSTVRLEEVQRTNPAKEFEEIQWNERSNDGKSEILNNRRKRSKGKRHSKDESEDAGASQENNSRRKSGRAKRKRVAYHEVDSDDSNEMYGEAPEKADEQKDGSDLFSKVKNANKDHRAADESGAINLVSSDDDAEDK